MRSRLRTINLSASIINICLIYNYGNHNIDFESIIGIDVAVINQPKIKKYSKVTRVTKKYEKPDLTTALILN